MRNKNNISWGNCLGIAINCDMIWCDYVQSIMFKDEWTVPLDARDRSPLALKWQVRMEESSATNFMALPMAISILVVCSNTNYTICYQPFFKCTDYPKVDSKQFVAPMKVSEPCSMFSPILTRYPIPLVAVTSLEAEYRFKYKVII